MASASVQAGSPMDPTVFAKPIFAKEVADWLQRADETDRDKFHRVFDTLKKYTEPGPPPDASKAFAEATIAKMRACSARPAVPARGGSGWTYNATRVALKKADVVPPQKPSSLAIAVEQIDQHRPHSAPSKSNRELKSLLKAKKASGSRVSNGSKGSSNGELDGTEPPAGGMVTKDGRVLGVDMSIYQTSYNARDMYPEMYEQALKDTRTLKAPNFNFVSAWGDSLKSGNDAKVEATRMRSQYTITNDQVVQYRTDFDVRAEQQYFAWMKKQKTYFGELLKAGKQKDVEKMLSEASTEERRELLEVLRQVYAMLKPEMLKSRSQAEHCPMVRTEDPVLTQLLTEQTKAKTMGVVRVKKPGDSKPGLSAMANRSGATDVDTALAGRQLDQWNQQVLLDAQPPAEYMQQHYGQQGESGAKHEQHVLPRPSSRSGNRPMTPMAVVDMKFEPGAAGPRPGRGGGSSGHGVEGKDGSSPSSYQGLKQDMLSPLAALVSKQKQQLSGQRAMRPGTAPVGSRPFKSSMPKPNATIPKDTFQSKVPLKWGTLQERATSTYNDAFGSLGQVGGNRRALSAHGPIKYREVTCPIGAVNKVTAMAPFRNAYPVPECFVQKIPLPQANKDVLYDTNYQLDYAPRTNEDAMRSIAAAAEQTEHARKMLLKSTLPMGPKNGINLLNSDQWVSEHHDNYVPQQGKGGIDLEADKHAAATLKAVMSGPTAAVGALTAIKAS